MTTDVFSALGIQRRVINALVLRDMRTRFGRKISGWAIMVLWPLTHIFFLMIGYLMAHRVLPLGTSPAVFIATGVLPYILCLYPSRMIMFSVMQNRPLLNFPPVFPVDIILARSILEIINSFYVVCIFAFCMYALDVNIWPLDISEAILALLATIYFGFSVGFISSVIYAFFRPWLAIQIAIMILGYVASGAYLPVSNLPSNLQYYVWFNPLMHSVEWLRLAYFGNGAAVLLSKEYFIAYSTVILLLGLALERISRGLLMQHT